MGHDPENLEKAGIRETELFLALTSNDETNLIAAMTAREMGANKTIARVRQPFYQSSVHITYRRTLDIDLVVSPEWLVAMEFIQHISQPAAIAVENFAEGQLQMRQFEMEEDHAFADLPLITLQPHLPEDLLISMITKNGNGNGNSTLIIPRGDYVLQGGDKLTVIGLPDSVEKFGETFASVEAEQPIKTVFILGGGIKGHFLAEMLEHQDYNVTILEGSRDRCDFLSQHLHKTTIIRGDGTRLPILKEERVEKCDLFIACTGDDETNLMSCLQARSLDVPRVFTVMNRPDYAATLEQFGIDLALSPRRLISNRVMALINRGEVRSLSVIEDGRAELVEYLALADSPIVDNPLKKIRLPEGVLLTSILREGEVKVPRGDTEIQPGDIVLTLSLAEKSKAVEQLFGARHSE